MTELTYLFGAIALLAGALASITIWAPRRLAIKVLALGGVTLFLPLAYAGFAQLLALPKPVALEWWQANAEEATVLAASMREDEAIYLWLQLKNVPEPRAYSLPWHRELAEQLQAAQREAEESQSQVQMRLPFENSLDELEPKFYAMPQPQLPPKDLDRRPAQVYDRQAQRNS
jgi:hypothetical protein